MLTHSRGSRDGGGLGTGRIMPYATHRSESLKRRA
jgi:hypothetical protein